jgi:hypothetical protein
MATPTLLDIPVEVRFRIFDYLPLECNDITVSTVVVNPKSHAAANRLVAQHGGVNNLPVEKFIEVSPILAAGTNTISPSEHGQAGFPAEHRLVFRAALDKPMLDIAYEMQRRPWLQSVQLATVAFVCRQLRAEVNSYLRVARSPFFTEGTLYVTYPLGLLAIHKALPGLLSRAPHVVLAGHYDPWAAAEEVMGNSKIVDEEANEAEETEEDGETEDEEASEHKETDDIVNEEAVEEMDEGFDESFDEDVTDWEYSEDDETDDENAEEYEQERASGDLLRLLREYQPNGPRPLCQSRGTYERASLVVDMLVKQLPVIFDNDQGLEGKNEESTRTSSEKFGQEDEALARENEAKNRDCPLELRLHVPRGLNSHALATVAPSPYASVVRGTQFSVVTTDCNFRFGGERCDGSKCNGRAWVVFVAGRQSISKANSGDRSAVTSSSMELLFDNLAGYARVIIEGSDEIETEYSILGHANEVMARLERKARNLATVLWRKYARKQTVRPHISFECAINAAVSSSHTVMGEVVGMVIGRENRAVREDDSETEDDWDMDDINERALLRSVRASVRRLMEREALARDG